jgi:ParB-like chromosome segregation protein Spo0J
LADGWQYRNLGRPQQNLMDDVVLKVAEAIENNSSVPAIIVWRRPGGIDVLDGHQRIGACELAELTEFAAYIAHVTQEIAERLGRVCNLRLHGKRPPPYFEVDTILRFLDEGKSAKEVACLVGSTRAAVELAHYKRLAVRILQRHDREVQEDRRNGVLGELGRRLSECDEVLCEAWRLIVDADLTAKEAFELISEICEHSDKSNFADVAKLVIKNWRDDAGIHARIVGREKGRLGPLGAVSQAAKILRTQLRKYKDTLGEAIYRRDDYERLALCFEQICELKDYALNKSPFAEED